ncbi:MAG: methyl-accepting chemotaxis protein [Humidesulfovibrio sp.]|nr:methyl-accepting chemotaxis protein [Humidesulfovibrio sp.]
MNGLRNVQLRTKLLISFLLVSLLTLFVGFVGSSKINDVKNNDRRLYEEVTVPLTQVADVATAFQRMRVNAVVAVNHRDEAELAEAVSSIQQHRTTVRDALLRFDKTPLTNEERQAYNNLLSVQEEYRGSLNTVLAYAQADKKDEALKLLQGDARATARRYQDAIDKLQDAMTGNAQATSLQNQREAQSATTMMYAAMAFGFLASVVLGLLLTRDVMAQLGEDPGYLHEVAKKLSGGDLDGPFRPHKTEGSVYALMLGIVHSMRKQLAFSEGVMQGVAAPFSVFSPQDTTLFTNQAMLNLMEISGKPEDYLGKQSGEYIYGVKGKETLSTRALREKRPLFAEANVEARSGQTKHVSVSSAPFFDERGEMLGTVSIWLDQTSAIQAKHAAERSAEGMLQAAQQLEKVVEVVSSASEELSAQVEQSSRGTEVQSSRVAETATAMEQMNATVLEVAKNASQAAESSATAKDKAAAGAQIVSQVVQGINTMQTVSQAMKEDMSALGKQADGIGAIMSVISDIADQTNLLALNAAIEAARAGDAGRGFAVVADEVRKLAEKTMAATQEVGEAIGGIQNGAKKNLENVARAAATIEQATDLAHQSGEALHEIVRLVEISTDQVRSIAAASEEQSAASEEINRSIEEINRISSETATAMNQSAQAVGELASQAGSLRGLIDNMKCGV